MTVPQERFDVQHFFDRTERDSDDNRLFMSQGRHFRECFVSRARFVEDVVGELGTSTGSIQYEGWNLNVDTDSSSLWRHAYSLFEMSRAVVTITEIVNLVRKQRNGEEGILNTDFRNNVFFVRDWNGNIRIVHVKYSRRKGGWGIGGWFTERNESNDDQVKWLANWSQYIFRC